MVRVDGIEPTTSAWKANYQKTKSINLEQLTDLTVLKY